MIRIIIGTPVLLARKLVADPIMWADDMLKVGKPIRKPIRFTVDLQEYNRKGPMDLETAVAERMKDPDISNSVAEQLFRFGSAQVLAIIKNTDPEFKVETSDIHDKIVGLYRSLAGINADVHAQGVGAGDKPPCVVLNLNGARPAS